MPFTEMGQTTFLCVIHCWATTTLLRQIGKRMNFLHSDVEPVPKSRLGYGTISFATTREQVSLEPATASTSQAHKHIPGCFVTGSPYQADPSPGKDYFHTGDQMYWIHSQEKNQTTPHPPDTQCTNMPDLVSSKTQMTTPKTSCE